VQTNFVKNALTKDSQQTHKPSSSNIFW